MNYVSGTELSAEDRQLALSWFTNRYTGDHKPLWARTLRTDGSPFPVHFRSDAEWLECSRFAVTRTGRLDRRCRHHVSFPTWPDNPELRKER